MKTCAFPLIASTAALFFAAMAKCQVYAANTFGPDQSFDLDQGFPISGTNANNGNRYTHTEDFTASVSGLLREVTVPVGYVILTGSNGITLNLEDSNSNVLTSWTDNSLGVYGGSDQLTTLVNSNPSVRLTLGASYKLEMTPFANDTWAIWEFSPDHLAAAYSVQVTSEPAPGVPLSVGLAVLIGASRRKRRSTFPAGDPLKGA